MKMIEIVVLLGAQCVSPVENTAAVTEAGKVQCAVVIERDTDAGTFRIIPAGASREPEVVAVLERFDGQQANMQQGFAPPVATAPAAALPAVPPAVSAGAEVPPTPKPGKAAGKPHKCLGEARPRWYTNAEGRRKYRCAIPG